MPFDRYEWLQRSAILSFEEIERIVRQFARLGVDKVRLTGGEPLLRKHLGTLVERLAAIDGIRELCLTTNGTRLRHLARPLRDAGLSRVNVSLDTLDPGKFHRITRRDELARVLEGMDVAAEAGLQPLKVNMVVERGVNDDEVVPMLEFCRQRGFSLRYIEFMDVGNANEWNLERVVSSARILEMIRAQYALEEIPRHQPSDPATRYRLPATDGSFIDVGIIASVTKPFCGACSRARITAEGKLVTCLFSSEGTDLKRLMRSGCSDEQLAEAISARWRARDDRYSEERLEAIRANRYDPSLRAKIEMITLGG